MNADEKRFAIEDALAKLPNGSQTALAKLAGVTQDEVHYHRLAHQLIAPSRPGVISEHRLHTLWQVSTVRVDNYLALLREQKAVDEASNFGRWLNNSGLIEILKDNPQPEPLPVDGRTLARKVALLIEGCGEVYQKWGTAIPPEYAQTDIHEIRDKLALILEKLAA